MNQDPLSVASEVLKSLGNEQLTVDQRIAYSQALSQYMSAVLQRETLDLLANIFVPQVRQLNSTLESDHKHKYGKYPNE